MPLYSYRAVDGQGHPVEGTMDEPSAARVSTILEERGLQVSSIDQVARRRGLLSLKPRLGWDDIQTLNDQLLAVSRSRLPLVPALETMARDVKRRGLRRVLTELRMDLERGKSLDEALDAHADSIPFVYRNMVRAGERAGNLPGVLAIAASHSRRMIDFRNSLQTALAYPAVVLALTFTFMLLFLYYVLPLYVESYADVGESNEMLGFWQSVSSYLRENTLALLVVIGGLAAGIPLALRLLRRAEIGAYLLDSAKERIPVFGKTYSLVSVARFTRSLGVLLASGVPALEALDLAAAASGNASLRRNVRAAAERIAEGEHVADALSDTGYFTHTFCWLLSTGEQRGEMEETLFSIADTYEQDIRRRDRLVEYLTLPVLIIFLGLFIGAVVTSIYLPVMGWM